MAMANIKGILVSITRSGRLPLAMAIVATTFGAQSASAANIAYTGYSWIGDNISISSPHSVSGGAGQITLTGVSNYSSSTILAWCLDIYDFLQTNGTVKGGGPLPPPSPLPPNFNKIGGLMQEGNTLVAQGSLSYDGVNWNKADLSAAAQVAIWTAEYGSLGYSISLGSLNANSTNFAALVQHLTGNAAVGVNYWTLADADGSPTNQTLGTLSPVPGPILGSGLPGLILAASGVLGWWRRRRSAVAAA
jgi:hypothetical protein